MCKPLLEICKGSSERESDRERNAQRQRQEQTETESEKAIIVINGNRIILISTHSEHEK